MSTNPTGGRTNSAEGALGTQQWDRTNEILDVVDRWRARVDELRVQLDLAKLDLRDQATRQLEVAVNANVAATSKLRDAYHDARVTAERLREGVEEIVRDVNEAFEAVQDVLTRG